MERQNTNQDIEMQAAVHQMQRMVSEIGLSHKVLVSSVNTRNGAVQLSISSRSDIRLANADKGIAEILNGNSEEAVRYVSAAIGKPGVSMSSTELMQVREFQESSLLEAKVVVNNPNTLLNEFTKSADSLPVTYGSTSGINAAEVMETLICADESRILGKETEVVFDFSGEGGLRAHQILSASLEIFDNKQPAEDFINSLGASAHEQTLNAAEIIFDGQPISFVPSEEIFIRMGAGFSVGKLLVLARLSGSDPKLFGDKRAKDLYGASLSTPVSEIQNPAGFTYYAREAILGADFDGSYVAPFKLTDKANIYKILATYGALASQRDGQGMILCPIQKHRIQTRRQIHMQSGDPVDIRVLAYLSQILPSNFARLANDFRNHCRVLSSEEAIKLGTADKRFCIEDYFKEVI